MDTYQSLLDWTKVLWLIVPLAFLLGQITLVQRHCVAVKKAETARRDDHGYTIHRDSEDRLHVTRQGAALEREHALVMLDEPNSGDGGNVH